MKQYFSGANFPGGEGISLIADKDVTDFQSGFNNLFLLVKTKALLFTAVTVFPSV